MTLHSSTELRQVIAEATDIAGQVRQRLNTAHLLLALFTVRNRAEILLKEKQIDEDKLLDLVHTVEGEPKDAIKEVQQRARQIATGCQAESVDCLHLLVALCGMRETLAYDLLRRSGLSVPKFRNTALSFVTGRLPRRLLYKKPPEPAQGVPAPSAAPRAQPQPPRSLPPTVQCPSVAAPKAVVLSDFCLLPGRGAAAALPSLHPGSKWDLDPAQYPMLCSLGRNITVLADAGKIDSLIGRERELEEVIDTLLKRRSNNPLLVGEPGVGKTAIVEGLALHIVKGHPETRGLGHRSIIELDVSTLLAGTQFRGAFSEKLKNLREEVRKSQGAVVVFFDEIHTIIGAGATGEGAQDAANELKSALARGEFPCIGATTHDEYRRFIEQDAAFTRRFRVVQVNEPSAEETLSILKGVAKEYSRHHLVTYDEEALSAAVRLSSRYITDRCLPDKAIALLDLAGSRARRSGKSTVDREAMARVVSAVAHVPVDRLLMTDAERLLNMEQILGLQIIGHAAVIRAIAGVIRRNYAGFAHRRPMGSFLFLGPSGVGKTECARALSKFMFSTRDALVQLDMSEYTEPHSVARLLGSPPGYVGHHEGGQLTEAVRQHPYSVVLFDEIDKAHPEVRQLLLQVLDEGRLTDGRGRAVDFTNVVVILTTNLGTQHLTQRAAARIGFSAASTQRAEDLAKQTLEEARKGFPPELWGRMEEHLFFRPLSTDDLVAIAGLMIKDSAEQLRAERGMSLQIDPQVAHFLVARGCLDATLGARPLRGVIRGWLEEPLAETILSGKFQPGEAIQILAGADRLVFEHAGSAGKTP